MGLFDINSSDSIFSQTSDSSTTSENIFDIANSYNPNKSESIFDSRNSMEATDNNQMSSIFSEMNISEKKFGSLSLIDRKRGIETSRIDNSSGEISLAEQYKYAHLDKRTFGGRYNITLQDMYKDDKLYAANQGLITDGFIDDEGKWAKTASARLLSEKLKQDVNSNTKATMNTDKNINHGKAWNKKPEWAKKSAWTQKSAWQEEPEWKKTPAWKEQNENDNKDETVNEKENSIEVIGKKNDFSELDKLKELKRKEKKIKITKNKLGDIKQEKNFSKEVEHKNIARPEFDEDFWIKIKTINLRAGREIITEKDILEMKSTGKIPDEILPYKELKVKIAELEKDMKHKDISKVKKQSIQKRIDTLKPFLIERAILGDF